MKILSPVLLSIIIATALLSGCASPAMDHRSDSMGAMSKSGGDMTAMCDMHKKMMGSRSPQEQHAMMEENMKDMTPEMRAKHMDQIKQCM